MEKKKSSQKKPQNHRRDNKKTSGLKTFAKYSGMGFQMLVIILLFYWAGSKLDERASTEKPVYTAVLTVLGVFAGLYLSLRDFIGKGND